MHTTPANCSWYWKRLHKLKNEMQDWYCNDRYQLTSSGVYSASSNYIAMLEALNKISISKLVWGAISLPRHSCIVWLALQGKLQTKDRLLKMNIPCENKKCYLCEEDVLKTHQHLFGECR